MTGAVALPLKPRRLTIDYQRVVNAVFALQMFTGMISLIEPSPYDFVTLLAVPIWAFGGFKIHRAIAPVLLLWIVFETAGFLALMPHWEEADARLYQLQSLYLFVTTVFFTIFFSERTLRRATVCLNAFTIGSVVSAIVGIIGYLDIGGLAPLLTTVESRVSGTFKDPNVFGSYLVLAATYLLQMLLLGSTRRILLTMGSLGLVLIGVFISYSRGSWGAALAALIIMAVTSYLTADSRAMRQRILTMSGLALGLGLFAMVAALSDTTVRNFFLQRAAVTQEYDEGYTGRFGNQMRSLPMLVEKPEGFGPLRFRLIFDLEPHNSYIGAFANDGWIGGFAWFALVLTSLFVGFRLMFKRSPFQRLAQVFAPTLFVLLMQGFQIDVDHWRQLFLCFGAVWGMEAARLRWAAGSPHVRDDSGQEQEAI
ncbi:O-antigen ligase [Beijerinckia sp. L45]|uniref:O-antigen ligase family protein n=1 Tax=Beijerinckia sp. L45 TaxID=1641855 RepID=UPI00131B4F19|nr:hypothetical protein [Beijerinckia sp. L45]